MSMRGSPATVRLHPGEGFVKRSIAAAGGLALIGAMLAGPGSAQAAPSAADATAMAGRLLAGHSAELRATAGDTFKAYRSTVDADGSVHVRYTRTYNGLRVYGGDVVMHTDAKGGYKGVSNSLVDPLSLSTTPAVAADAAGASARKAFAGQINAPVLSQ